MTKVELVKDPQVYFDFLTSDEINVLNANFVSDEVIEIHYENNESFIAPNSKTNVGSSLLSLLPTLVSNSMMSSINFRKERCITTLTR